MALLRAATADDVVPTPDPAPPVAAPAPADLDLALPAPTVPSVEGPSASTEPIHTPDALYRSRASSASETEA